MHVDFCIRPVPVAQSTANEGVYSVDGAWFGWFLNPTNADEAELWLYDGNGTGGGTWTSTGSKIQKTSGTWPMRRIALRQDYARQTFDVGTAALGNTPSMVGADFGFKNSPVSKTEIVFAVGTTSGNVQIDDLTVTSVNPGGTDQDKDGMIDIADTNPTVDNRDLDSDNDSIPDLQEYLTSSTAIDGDGLSFLQEGMYGTNPIQSDTDGDGVSDSTEVANGTDPVDLADSVVTTHDCMQKLTIILGGDAPSGVGWEACVVELLPDGQRKVRFRVVAGEEPITEELKSGRRRSIKFASKERLRGVPRLTGLDLRFLPNSLQTLAQLRRQCPRLQHPSRGCEFRIHLNSYARRLGRDHHCPRRP
jgi:hypothetical protein